MSSPSVVRSLRLISAGALAIALLAPAPGLAQAANSGRRGQAEAPVEFKFDFSSTGEAKPGWTRVAPGAAYSAETGYGFEPGATTTAGDGGNIVTSERPFSFSVKVPEGNYLVKATFGDSTAPSVATIRAESRRLLIEKAEVPAGKVDTVSFSTNVRTPALPPVPTNAPGGDAVRLDQFDQGSLNWDDKLTIEFNNTHPALRSLEITRVSDRPTVFLAGDSTVTDQAREPGLSWGQALPRFLKADVVVANHAQSGETLKSFANALRLDKILSQMKKGDYLFIQFAHNDEKASWPQTYVQADTTYKAYLKAYIAEARLRGATPVLVTSMDRFNTRSGAPSHGHGGYPEAMRQVAKEENVPLIDLYNSSIAFYEAVGAANARQVSTDGTHSINYGGYEMAKIIVTGIRQNKLDLANSIVDGFQDFDPAHPDAVESVVLPPSPSPGRGGRRGGGAAPAATGTQTPAPADVAPGAAGPGPL